MNDSCLFRAREEIFLFSNQKESGGRDVTECEYFTIIVDHG